MIRTPEEQRLTRSVYASVAILRQYPGPLTDRRYAEIPNVGLFEWQYGNADADNGTTIIRPTGGGADGAWVLTLALSSLAAGIDALDARVDALEQNPAGPSQAAFDALDTRVAALEPTDLPTVVMFNGQSNMMAAPALTMGFSELTALLGSDLLGYGHTAAAFVPVVDGGCNARANVGGSGTGPGPGLGLMATRVARLIADETGSTVRTYALAYPGQSITYFLPASATLAYFEDGTQHATLNNYNLIKSYVTASGIVPEYYVFCQGEADAGMPTSTYRGHLDTLDAALQADFPGMKMVVIGTIGNRDDRSAAGQPACTGVRKAQREFAEAHADRVLFVDNTDMRGNTAFFTGTHYYNGAASSIGYEEVALRVFAALRGLAARPNVPAANSPQETYSWEHWWGYRHSLNGAGVVASWSDDIGSDSLVVENGTPAHVASDAGFGGRCVMQFDYTASERFTETSIVGGNKWVFFWAMRVLAASKDGNLRTIWQLETTGAGGNRIDFSHVSGVMSIGFNGSSVTFAGAPTIEAEVEHTYLVAYDGTAGTAKLYIDGLLQSSLTGLANVNTGANARIRIGSFSGIAHFGGEIPFIACKAMPSAMPTDAEAYALHVGARAELKLET